MKRKLSMILALSATLTMLAACNNANEISQAELNKDFITIESTSSVEIKTEVKRKTPASEEIYKKDTPDTSAESSETPDKTESKSDETENAENENPQYASLDEKMPAPFLTGINMDGDENADFYQPCNRVLDNIPVELMRLRNETEVSNWVNSFPSIAVAPSSITEYANIYSFITSFDISKEEAETALSVYLNSDDEQIKITREEFDTIFSGDIAAVTNTFASDYSIVIGKSVYCPNWIYTHSTDDYAMAGITADVVAEKTSAYSNFNLTEDARIAFADKLSAFTGETINIEPVKVNADGHYNDFAYDIADDEMEDVDENEKIVEEIVSETK